MIVELNRAVALVEEHLAEDPARRVDAAALAARIGTTEHHLRRMFASLAGMPLSDYVRRRRMSLAARDLTTGRADLLTVAVRHGYGSSEAFGRAFRAVHGASPAEVRRDGGPAGHLGEDRDRVVPVPTVAAARGTRDRRGPGHGPE